MLELVGVVAGLWHVLLLLLLTGRWTNLVDEASLHVGSRLLWIFIVQDRNAWNL